MPCPAAVITAGGCLAGCRSLSQRSCPGPHAASQTPSHRFTCAPYYQAAACLPSRCQTWCPQPLSPTPCTCKRRLDAGITWGQWWNYLRRQLFVMDTYSSPANARLNHAMLALHAYLSSALLAALLLGAGSGFSVWHLGIRV